MKQDLRVSVTKRIIREGLLRLLETKPLNKIKVSELCETSGVNRATFYRHYTAPQDVLREMETEYINQIPKFDHPPRNDAEVRLYIETVCTYIHAHSNVVKILFCNKTDEDLQHSLDIFCQSYLERTDTQLDADSIRLIIALLRGGCHCLLQKWILEDIPKTPQEVADILCHVIRLSTSDNFSTTG